MILKEFKNWAISTLKKSNIQNAIKEVDWILEELAGLNKIKQITQPEISIECAVLKLLKQAIYKRTTHFPLQYILGKTYFMGLEFIVGPGVLIPRADTEVLVEWAMEAVPQHLKVLDIGTGSGCIAISLKHYRPDLNITAIDISKEALLFAEKNAKNILKEDSIEIGQSDLFKSVGKKYDVILSNPPYLTEDDMKKIDENLKYEPELALTPKGDGLFFYQQIAGSAKQYLNNKGLIAVEIGYNIERQVLDVFEKASFKLVKELKDLQDIVRVLVFQG